MMYRLTSNFGGSFRLWLYCVVWVWLLLGVIASTTTSEESIDLQSLTNEELEQICTIRGFELNKELDQNGKPIEYTHEDYMEAARQCLDIEAEMEKIIQENPEILKDIEDETKAMLKEQEKLTEQKNELEAKLKEAQTAQDTVPKPENTTPNDTSSQSNSSDQTNPVEEEEKEEEETIDLDALLHDDEGNNNNNNDDDSSNNVNINDSPPVDTKEEDTAAASSKDDLIMEEESDSPSTISSMPSAAPRLENAIKKVKESDQPLITIREVIMEFREQVLKDLDRIGKIVLPPSVRGPLVEDVLKPAYKVGKRLSIQTYEFMKRYLSVFFAQMKEKVETELQKRKDQIVKNEQEDTISPVQDMKLQ